MCVGQYQRRTDGVERKLIQHRLFGHRLNRLLRLGTRNLQRAGCNDDPLKWPLQPPQMIRHRRLICDVEPIRTARQAGPFFPIVPPGLSQRGTDSARSPSYPCFYYTKAT